MQLKPKTLTKKKLLDFLAELESDPRDYLTIYITSTSFPCYTTESEVELSPFAGEIKSALSTQVVLQEAQRYGTGAVVFWSESGNKLIVIPPFALSEDRVFRGRPETSLLWRLLKKERLLGLVLVTWGSYALGVFKGDKLVESKTGTGYIHKRHRKGGRSEKRFARRTEEQKNDFLRRVANRIEERFRGYRPEQILFGGNRLILKLLIDESSYLRSEVQQISKRFFNVRSANQEALVKSLEDVNRSLLFSVGEVRASNGDAHL